VLVKKAIKTSIFNMKRSYYSIITIIVFLLLFMAGFVKNFARYTLSLELTKLNDLYHNHTYVFWLPLLFAFIPLIQRKWQNINFGIPIIAGILFFISGSSFYFVVKYFEFSIGFVLQLSLTVFGLIMAIYLLKEKTWAILTFFVFSILMFLLSMALVFYFNESNISYWMIIGYLVLVLYFIMIIKSKGLKLKSMPLPKEFNGSNFDTN